MKYHSLVPPRTTEISVKYFAVPPPVLLRASRERLWDTFSFSLFTHLSFLEGFLFFFLSGFIGFSSHLLLLALLEGVYYLLQYSRFLEGGFCSLRVVSKYSTQFPI